MPPVQVATVCPALIASPPQDPALTGQSKRPSSPSAEKFKFCHLEQIWDVGGRHRQTGELRDGHTDGTRGEIKLTGSTFPSVHTGGPDRKCLPDYQRCDPARLPVAFGATASLGMNSLGFVMAAPLTLAAATRCGGIPVRNHFLLIRHWGAHIWPRRLSLNSPAGRSAGPAVCGGKKSATCRPPEFTALSGREGNLGVE